MSVPAMAQHLPAREASLLADARFDACSATVCALGTGVDVY